MSKIKCKELAYVFTSGRGAHVTVFVESNFGIILELIHSFTCIDRFSSIFIIEINGVSFWIPSSFC